MKLGIVYRFGWVMVFISTVLLAAWIIDWKFAGILALCLGSITVIWQTIHIQWLLSTLQYCQSITAHSSIKPIDSNFLIDFKSVSANKIAIKPPFSLNPMGVWGDIFYALRHLIKAHRIELTAIQNQQNRLMQAVHASPNVFILLDKVGKIAWLNNAAQRLLGLDCQRDTGQVLAFLLRNPAITALLEHNRIHQPVTIEIKKTLIEIQSLPFGDQQTLLLGQDLTKSIRTEQIRRDFIANVSHELRTPLTVLTGYTELLLDHINSLPFILQEAVKHIDQHTQRMNSLTQDLLQLAVLDSSNHGDALINCDTVNVNEWLLQVKQSAIPLAHTLGGCSNLEFATCNPQWTVQGNSKELYSALFNLVDNAIRYTPVDGSIVITTHIVNNQNHTEQAIQQHLHIAVSDTGCGIESVYLPRLTERFYRVSSSRHRGLYQDNTGTGLGLAIVKHIMLRHNGELHITSTPEKGSCFTLILPI